MIQLLDGFRIDVFQFRNIEFIGNILQRDLKMPFEFDPPRRDDLHSEQVPMGIQIDDDVMALLARFGDLAFFDFQIGHVRLGIVFER